jgi:hypothetical protein
MSLKSVFEDYKNWRRDEPDVRDFPVLALIPAVLSLGLGGAIGEGINQTFNSTTPVDAGTPTEASQTTEQEASALPSVLTPNTKFSI